MRLNIFYILLIALCGLYGCKNHQQPIIKENLNILPTIYPEYQGALLPVNIAPLNFKIQDEGDEWMIQIQGKGNPITITAHVHDHFIRVSLVKGMTIDAVLPAFFV